MKLILLATHNPHKIDEIRAMFGAAGEAIDLEFKGISDLEHTIAEPNEDQATFEANAVLKARHYAQLSGLWCLADDSGLAVDALGGEPGVHSARYAGCQGPRSEVDLANNRLLMLRLGDLPSPNRTARFVCAMALCGSRHEAAPINTLALVRGTVEGRILTADETADRSCPHFGRGHNGFGYDPLFLLPALGKTTAELHPDHKNRISHRGHAAQQMWQQINTLIGER